MARARTQLRLLKTSDDDIVLREEAGEFERGTDETVAIPREDALRRKRRAGVGMNSTDE